MKRGFVYVFLFILLISFVVAAEEPNVNEEEYLKTKETIDKNMPIGDDGKLNISKFNSTQSKAEERIGEINFWLDDNASWLKIVFGMVPEISFLFGFVLYVWLFIFVNWVMNENLFINWMSSGYSRLAGLGVFVVLIIIKFVYSVGLLSYNVFKAIIDYIIPAGIIGAIITIVLFIALCVVCWPLAARLLFMLNEWVKKRKEAKAKEQIDTDRKVLHAEVEGASGK